MAKVPTIYDIGNFQLDWNNVENIANPGIGIATKDGVLHLHCLDNTSPEGLSASIIVAPELPSDSTDESMDLLVKDPSSKFISVGGYEAENKGSLHLIIPVHKGENFYFYEKHVETVYKRQFIPFLYQGVEPTPGCVSYVIETGHNQDNTAFYRKYSDGYIEQWGTLNESNIISGETNGNGYTVNFPISFVTSNPHVDTQPLWDGNSEYPFLSVVRVLNANYFKVTGSLDIKANNTMSIMWKACGY